MTNIGASPNQDSYPDSDGQKFWEWMKKNTSHKCAVAQTFGGGFPSGENLAERSYRLLIATGSVKSTRNQHSIGVFSQTELEIQMGDPTWLC